MKRKNTSSVQTKRKKILERLGFEIAPDMLGEILKLDGDRITTKTFLGILLQFGKRFYETLTSQFVVREIAWEGVLSNSNLGRVTPPKWLTDAATDLELKLKGFDLPLLMTEDVGETDFRTLKRDELIECIFAFRELHTLVLTVDEEIRGESDAYYFFRLFENGNTKTFEKLENLELCFQYPTSGYSETLHFDNAVVPNLSALTLTILSPAKMTLPSTIRNKRLERWDVICDDRDKPIKEYIFQHEYNPFSKMKKLLQDDDTGFDKNEPFFNFDITDNRPRELEKMQFRLGPKTIEMDSHEGKVACSLNLLGFRVSRGYTIKLLSIKNTCVYVDEFAINLRFAWGSNYIPLQLVITPIETLEITDCIFKQSRRGENAFFKNVKHLIIKNKYTDQEMLDKSNYHKKIKLISVRNIASMEKLESITYYEGSISKRKIQHMERTIKKMYDRVLKVTVILLPTKGGMGDEEDEEDVGEEEEEEEDRMILETKVDLNSSSSPMRYDKEDIETLTENLDLFEVLNELDGVMKKDK